ncbi:hypothetical protein WJ95_13480 [Burkholderia ubonensis]|uniref:tyrosine-type recombinase/integrase n=1 Tax=Burkholderia ubonensis TaxID=101571 RepID=UPI00075716B8|nr:tyrosine-type recombinase/integrase [Burkholderia ubonensis]KVP88929.1 hypothetical protein WJ95_13480 [Burkholderia ubonensis]
MHARHFWSIKYVFVREFPHRRFPLVFLNGEPGYVINEWIAHMLDSGIEQSSLEERIRAVLHLHDFCWARHGQKALTEQDAHSLVGEFLTAKKVGTDKPDGTYPLGLFWRPVRRATLLKYLAALNSFDTWQSAFHGSKRLNPAEQRLMTAWELYSEFRRRERWDPMLHLFPARRKEKILHLHQAPRWHQRLQQAPRSSPKCFPLAAFVDLVEQCNNPRDKMLYLQMFGLGLRTSELLHLFTEDVFGIGQYGDARIRLDDPETGQWKWRDSQGKHRSTTRTIYLESNWSNVEFEDTHPELYRLVPRTRYGRRGGMYAGFKGMTFHLGSGLDPTAFGNEAVWIDPRIGVYFLKCFEAYMAEHFHGRPKRWPFHPWLYIQLDRKNFGLPMTLPAVKKMWNRSMKRLGLENLHLGPHSLRHLAGYYCANVLRHPIETTQVLLRHARVESTQIYYHLTNDSVRHSVLESVAQQFDISIGDMPQKTEFATLEIPPHWARSV